MNIVKRTVKIFGMAAMVMLISAVSVMAAIEGVDIDQPKLLNNGSFEEPSIGTTAYKQVAASDVPYWRTTAVGTNTDRTNQIELLRRSNNTYTSISGYLTPKVGMQAAELNAEEASTMYQYLYAPAGSVYEWGVSHRARNNARTVTDSDGKSVTYRDIMAVFIGPRQPVDPAKDGNITNGENPSRDQFTKTVDWLKNKGHLDTSGLQDGDCKAFEVFTTKFTAKGGFEGFDDYNDAISLTQTATHTEKWHVWIITSSKDNWYDFGVNAAEDCAANGDSQGAECATYKKMNTSYEIENTIMYKKPDYNYQYTVPASSDPKAATMYALCAYETASDHSIKPLTYGNFIDDVKFSLMVPLRVTSTEGGSTAVEIPGSTGTVTNTQEFSRTTVAGEKIKLTITPVERGEGEEGYYTFLGAFVNNKWKSATDTTLFTENENGTYTYEQDAEDGENYIHIVFAKNPYIIHSPNGGSYNGKTADTADKIEKADTYTFSETPTAGNQARFAHWIIAGVTNEDGTPVTVGANHTVVAVVNSEDSSKYDITVNDESGNPVATIQKTDVVVFVAHYSYPQTVNIYTMKNGKWELSEDGGTAHISWINMSEDASAQASNIASQTIYVEDNTIVSVSASPNEEKGYRFVRMVSDDNTVTTEKTYTYNADGPRTTSVYYMEGKRKPIVSYVDEKNTEDSPSYVWDTNLGEMAAHKKIVDDVGGIYGNTVSTAFTAFWPGDENTYTYIQWAIDIPFDTDTLVKTNNIHGDFSKDSELGDIKFSDTPYKTDSDAVHEKFKGEIYRCARENTPKQLTVNFPTVISGAASIYSTIILDGIYSPNSTALLHAVTEINAKAGNVLTSENGFSIRTDEDTYRTDNDNYYITTLN